MLAELKEKAALSDPDVVDSNAKNLEKLAKKMKVSLKAVSNNKSSFTTEFKRCGMSYSKRLHSLVVGNNAVRSVALDVEHKKKKRRIIINPRVIHSPNSPPSTARTTDNRFFITAGLTDGMDPSLLNEFQLQSQASSSDNKSKKFKVSNTISLPPSECALSMRLIKKILHPFLPEDCLGGVYKPAKSGRKQNTISLHPYCRSNYYEKLPKETLEVVNY